MPLAAGIGAAGGALSGVGRRNVLGKALGGAALGAGGALAHGPAASLLNAAKARLLGGGSPAGGYGDAAVGVDANGRNVDTGELVNGAAQAAGSGGGLLGAAGRAISGGVRALGRPGVLQTGLGILGTIQGAQRQGQANDLRSQGLASLSNVPRPDLGSVYADPGNPYARPVVPQTALASARASLRGY